MYKILIILLVLFISFSVPSYANVELDLNKGIASYLDNNFDDAIKHLQLVLEKDPGNVAANHMIGLSYLRLKQYNQAAQYLETTKNLDPNVENIFLDLATAYIKSEKYEEAINELNLHLVQNPNSATAYYYLGYAQFSLARYEEAIESFENSKRISSDYKMQSDYYQGVSYYLLDDYESSRNNFVEVIKIAPEDRLARSATDYLNILNVLGKNWWANFSAGFQYDTNVGLEPNDVKIFSDEKDSSLYLFANLGYKPYFTKEAVIGLNYQTYFNFHQDLTEFNVQSHKFLLYGEKDLKNTARQYRMFFITGYEIVLIDGSPADNLFSQSIGATPGLTIRWSDKMTSRVFYKFRYDDFDDFPERDAYNNSITWAQYYRYNNGRFILSPGFKLELNSTDDIPNTRNWTYWSPVVYIEALALLQHQITFFGRVHYYYQDYYDDDFNRKDNQFGLRLLLSKELYKRLFLDLAYEFIYNGSDSDFPGPEPYEYNRNIFTLGLSLRL